MKPDARREFQAHTIGGITSALIGALISLPLTLVIPSRRTSTETSALLVAMGLMLGVALYHAWLAMRSSRILNRLGIQDVVCRSRGDECDSLHNANITYSFFGLSAIKVLTEEAVREMSKAPQPERIEILYLDPACTAAIRSIAQIEGCAPEILKLNLETMLSRATVLSSTYCPTRIRLIPHFLIPTFRITMFDQDTMHVGEYAPNSKGYKSDLIVLRRRTNEHSLFSMFERYYKMSRELAVHHALAKAIVQARFQHPNADPETILSSVSSQADAYLMTAHTIQDVLSEYGILHHENGTNS